MDVCVCVSPLHCADNGASISLPFSSLDCVHCCTLILSTIALITCKYVEEIEFRSVFFLLFLFATNQNSVIFLLFLWAFLQYCKRQSYFLLSTSIMFRHVSLVCHLHLQLVVQTSLGKWVSALSSMKTPIDFLWSSSDITMLIVLSSGSLEYLLVTVV